MSMKAASIPRKSRMARATVVLPDPEPPTTPMRSGGMKENTRRTAKGEPPREAKGAGWGIFRTHPSHMSPMRPGVLALALLLHPFALRPAAFAAAAQYVPPSGDAWQTRDPRAANFDPLQLTAAVDFAKANPIPWSHDLAEQFKILSARERWP